MKVSFKTDDTMQPDDLTVYVQAATLTPAVLQILTTILTLADSHDTLPSLVGERVIVLPTHEIVEFEVVGELLSVHTRTEVVTSRGTRLTVLAQLDPTAFNSVTKSSLLNINYLTTSEASFSGNMTAYLANNMKLTDCRKYLPALKRLLGL